MTVRRARVEEAAQLTDIAHRAKAAWGYPANWITHWASQLTVDRTYMVANDVWVAAAGEVLCGFYALASDQDRVVLDHFWVAPTHHRRGVGRRLLEHARSQVRARGMTAIYIESDPNAAGFYRRFGARAIGSIDASIDGVDRTLPVFVLPTRSRTSEETAV